MYIPQKLIIRRLIPFDLSEYSITLIWGWISSSVLRRSFSFPAPISKPIKHMFYLYTCKPKLPNHQPHTHVDPISIHFPSISIKFYPSTGPKRPYQRIRIQTNAHLKAINIFWRLFTIHVWPYKWMSMPFLPTHHKNGREIWFSSLTLNALERKSITFVSFLFHILFFFISFFFLFFRFRLFGKNVSSLIIIFIITGLYIFRFFFLFSFHFVVNNFLFCLLFCLLFDSISILIDILLRKKQFPKKKYNQIRKK